MCMTWVVKNCQTLDSVLAQAVLLYNFSPVRIYSDLTLIPPATAPKITCFHLCLSPCDPTTSQDKVAPLCRHNFNAF